MRYLLLLIIVAFGSFSAPVASEFTIRIIQNGTEVKPVNGEVLLDKAPFRIDVGLEQLDGVYLYADFTDSIYRLNNDQPIPGMEDVPPNVMAEESFNTDHEMLISKEAWAYWFYDPQLTWHRFDTVMQVSYSNGQIFLCPKSIKQFYLAETETVLPVAQVEKPLYLFFFAASDAGPGKLDKERQRYKVKINWK